MTVPRPLVIVVTFDNNETAIFGPFATMQEAKDAEPRVYAKYSDDDGIGVCCISTETCREI